MIDLYRLNHFVTVARLGSFVRAAEELSLSQPALSRSIQALERHTGTRLLERGKGRVTTTVVGQAFFEQAQEVLLRAENLEHNLHAALDGTVGVLNFGIGPASASALLPQLLETLDRRYPGVTTRISVSSVGRMREELLARRLEFFVARDRQTVDPDPRIFTEELAEASPMFLVREGHPLLGASSIALNDLADYRLAAGSAWRESIETRPEHARELSPRIEMDNYDLLAHLARSSDTILIASNGFQRFGLVPLPTQPADFGIRASRIALFRLAGRDLSPVAIIAAEILRRGLQADTLR